MKRSLKLPLLVALALGSSHVMALDLGQIQVKSALGQPLLAEIPVQKATPAELQHLSVQLASGDAFARAGVTAGRPAVPLSFNVVDAGQGRKVIRITSEAAVNDPFMDLLIEIHGGHGKSVREYTILLDPPGSHPAPVAAQPAAPARVARPAAAPAPAAPAARPAAPRASSAAAEGSQLANGQFGPVERGQTLSSVAQRVLPAGVDRNQMMLALKQANPQAFYRDNINALKAGAVLRVPSKAEAEAVAVAAAAEDVRRQNGDWRSGAASSSPVTVADAGTRATASSSPTAQAASKDDHLALLPAKESSKAAVGTGGSGKALHQDLLRSQEALASLQQQSDNLKTQLKELSDINGKNERLLALKDNEIAELQKKLAAARKSAGLPAQAASAAAAPAVEAKPEVAKAAEPAAAPVSTSAAPAVASSAAHTAVAAATSAATAHAATVAAASQPAPAASARTEAARTAPVKVEQAKPLPAAEEPWYQQLWVQALGAGVVVLLLLLTLLGRRRKPKATATAKLAPSLADRFGETPADEAAAAGDDDDQNRLIDQLAEHPDDIGLHLELASLYYGRRDAERFEAAAEAMQAHVTDPQQDEWQEVLRMGEDLAPGHPLFSHHDVAGEAVPTHGFDIDQYATGHEPEAAFEPEAAAPAVPPPFPANPVKVSEYNFNFDLTPEPSRAATAEPVVEPVFHEPEVEAPAAHDEVSSWHFDEPTVEPVAQHEPLLEEPLAAGHDIEPAEFSDDPSDTKLDLARAYLDMGDPEGARAMLEEVLHEGSQTQRDVAKRMLDDLH